MSWTVIVDLQSPENEPFGHPSHGPQLAYFVREGIKVVAHLWKCGRTQFGRAHTTPLLKVIHVIGRPISGQKGEKIILP